MKTIMIMIIITCLGKFCGDLRRRHLLLVKWQTSIAEICGDDESAGVATAKVRSPHDSHTRHHQELLIKRYPSCSICHSMRP